jgi:hypothetical protein
MIRINEAHAIKLIADQAKVNLGAKIYSIACYDSKDRLMSGVLLMEDNGHSMEIHSAIFMPNGAQPEILWAVFNYVFKVRKVKKLFGRVPEGNRRARKFNMHIGFKEEAIIDDVFPGGEGLVVMGMYEEDCKFVNTGKKPPKVEFAPIEKTNIIQVHEYSQSKIGE